jgi:hypothetical protein
MNSESEDDDFPVYDIGSSDNSEGEIKDKFDVTEE